MYDCLPCGSSKFFCLQGLRAFAAKGCLKCQNMRLNAGLGAGRKREQGARCCYQKETFALRCPGYIRYNKSTCQNHVR